MPSCQAPVKAVVSNKLFVLDGRSRLDSDAYRTRCSPRPAPALQLLRGSEALRRRSAGVGTPAVDRFRFNLKYDGSTEVEPGARSLDLGRPVAPGAATPELEVLVADDRGDRGGAAVRAYPGELPGGEPCGIVPDPRLEPRIKVGKLWPETGFPFRLHRVVLGVLF